MDRHPARVFIRFIMKHAEATLAVVVIITIAMIVPVSRIQIDAGIFSYAAAAPEPEIVITPEEKPSHQLVIQGYPPISNSPDKGTAVEVPERINSFNESEYSNQKPFEPIEPVVNESEDHEGSFPDGYVIVFSSKQMFEPEVLNTVYEVRENLSRRYEIGACLSPFDYGTVEKRGDRLSIVPIAPVKQEEEWTKEDAEVFKERLLRDSVAKNFLYTDDGYTIMLYYRARGLNEAAITELDTIVNPLREYGRVALNGGGLITAAVMKYMNRDLVMLLVLCLVIILVVYYLSFRSIRAMLLPASLSVIGIVWTLGMMSLLGYKLTIVTILTPCLVLTLGSSYSIHMVSEYYEAARKKEIDKISDHLSKISHTILFAMLTTVAGFLSFLICHTPMFKEFGITIAMGVFICALLSFTYLPALLTLTKPPKEKQINVVNQGLLTKAVNSLSSVVIDRWWVFLLIALIITGGFFIVKDDIDFNSNYMSYFPSDDPIVQDSVYFAKTMGGTDPYYVTIRAPEGEKGFFYKSDNLKDVYAYECAVLAACPDIVQSLSFSQYVSFLNEVYNGEKGIPDSNGLLNLLSRVLKQVASNIGSDVLNVLINEDGTEVTLSMRNYDYLAQDLQTTASARRLETVLDYYRYMLPSGTTSEIHCLASSGVRASDMIMQDQNNATLLSLLLIFIIASIAVLSPEYGLYALVPVCVGVMINYIFMWAASIPFDIVTVGFSSVAIGAGVDDALHFIIRFRMLLKEKPELSRKEALKKNIKETGRPIILTTISVDAGLIMLLFASYTPIQYFGILMCVSLTGAMISTLTVLPPVILLISEIKKKLKPSRA